MSEKFIAALADPWVIVGFAAQALFMMRFLVQWISSEKARRSILPNSFWYFSIGGGAILTLYALHKGDPVFTLGQGLGLLIYLRNFSMILKAKRQARTPTPTAEAKRLVDRLHGDIHRAKDISARGIEIDETLERLSRVLASTRDGVA